MTAISRPRVLIVFGGRSSEHEVSCATAAGILTAIDRTKWDVIPLGITRDGQWVRVADDPSALRFKDGKGQSITAGATRVALTPGEGNLVELTYDGDPSDDTSRVVGVEDLGHVDIVFPLLHGPYGEDGTIQGLFEMADVRYVGCGVTSSAISMDKHLRVTCREDLPVAIKEAANHDPRIIVEASVIGREVECGVLGSRPDWQSGTSPLGEIVVPEGEFYDYEHKYVDDVVGLSCPADVPPAYAQRIRETAWRAFDALECEGLARVDFFLNEATDTVIINEVNTLPGFTPISMYPQMWAAAGVSYPDLLSELLTEASQRPLGLR